MLPSLTLSVYLNLKHAAEGATITGSTITVEGCGSSSLQGDVRFAEVMELMGATVKWEPYSITITGKLAGMCIRQLLSSP